MTVYSTPESSPWGAGLRHLYLSACPSLVGEYLSLLLTWTSVSVNSCFWYGIISIRLRSYFIFLYTRNWSLSHPTLILIFRYLWWSLYWIRRLSDQPQVCLKSRNRHFIIGNTETFIWQVYYECYSPILLVSPDGDNGNKSPAIIISLSRSPKKLLRRI